MKCRSCASEKLEKILDLGNVPIAHRFLKTPAGKDEFQHPMIVHLCRDCALLQVLDPVPPEELYRDYNFCFTAWKPQPHMADEIARIGRRLKKNELIVELGSNDGGFLSELKKAGFTNLAGVEPNRVANETSRKTGAAIFEAFFSAAVADEIVGARGKAALVVSRQAVEHILDLRGLAEGVKKVLRPEGWLLLEVPDFEIPMKYGDISSLWEEHVNYFTEATMCDFLERQGFGVVEIGRYPFSGGELMVLAQAGAKKAADRKEGRAQAAALSHSFPAQAAQFRDRLRSRMESNRKAGRVNAFYGTGCRANMLINAWKLAPLIDLIVDDQKEKQGLYLPGTGLQVRAGDVLDENPGDCFLAVNAENEEKVISRHTDYVKKGGRFLSVNSPSPLLSELTVSSVRA